MELGSDGSSMVNPSMAAVMLVEHGPDKSRWAKAMGLDVMSLILPLPGHGKHCAGAGTAPCPGMRTCCTGAKEVKVLTPYTSMDQEQRRRWEARQRR